MNEWQEKVKQLPEERRQLLLDIVLDNARQGRVLTPDEVGVLIEYLLGLITSSK